MPERSAFTERTGTVDRPSARLAVLIASVVAAGLLAACGTQAPPAAQGPAGPAASTTFTVPTPASDTSATAAPTGSGTKSGQAEAAKLLATQFRMPDGEMAWAKLTLRTDDGSLVAAFAVAGTTFSERGPNDDTYHSVAAKDGFDAYSNWARSGACPTTFKYDTYKQGDATLNVLTNVKYFMAGE